MNLSGGDLQEKISTSPLYLQSLGGVCVAVEDRIIGCFSEAASGRIWQEDRPCRELSALGAWEGTCVSRRSLVFRECTCVSRWYMPIHTVLP